MYSNLMNTRHNTLGAERFTAQPARPTQPDSPIVELRRAMRNGQTVWVNNGRRSKRMLQIESKNGKAVSLVEPGRGPLTITMYDTALTQSAYGRQTPQLGDLFNDVMGAVVPGWDKRPDWMKKIVVKPDPRKIFNAATKVVPPTQAEALAEAARKAGLNVYYSGQEVTPWGVRAAYETGGVLAGMQAVPGWVWLAGGGAILLLVVGIQRK